MVTEEQVCEELRDYLNGSITNLNTFRPSGWNQFFTSYEGINFQRKDTFPKGEIFILDDTDPTDNIGRQRGSTMTDSYGIFCYVSAGQKFNDGTRTRQDEALVQHFMRLIKDQLRIHDQTVAAITPKITSVTQDTTIEPITIDGNTFLRGLLTITTIRREIF